MYVRKTRTHDRHTAVQGKIVSTLAHGLAPTAEAGPGAPSAPRSSASHRAPQPYRADIDGLRAIAVLSVLLFHAAMLPGGFVGVDIFFVISGFLISRIIFREVDAGDFSIARFYERRIRRIVPALAAVMGATALVFALFATPMDYKIMGKSMAATAGFLSNLYFYLKGDYFDPSSETAPLLHTWSLAVEEQYYVLFPLAAVLMGRVSAARRLAFVLAGFLLSLALSVWLVRVNASLAFYLPFSRFWEILAGTLVALWPRAPATRGGAEFCGLAGLLLILGSLVLYHDGMLFPGESALPPCLGAALLLQAGRHGDNRISALLSLKPLVFVGLVSYSLYLWHWPVLVGARYVLMRELTPTEGALALGATGVLAFLSWRFIEQPFRHAWPGQQRRLFWATAGLGALTLAFTLATHVTGGFTGRFHEPARSYAAAALDTNPRRGECDRIAIDRLRAGEACLIGDPGAQAPSFVFIGDSFADAEMPAMDEAARRAGRKGYALVHSGCFPLVGVRQSNLECRDFVDAALAFVKSHPELGQAIVTARWTSALLGNRFGQLRGEGWFITDDASPAPGYAENAAVFRRGLARMVEALRPLDVTLLAFVPEQRFDVPRALMFHALFGRPSETSLPLSLHEARQAPLRQALAEVARAHPFRIVDVGARLCSPERGCPMLLDATPLYADDNHLSRSGGLAIADLFGKALGPKA